MPMPILFSQLVPSISSMSNPVRGDDGMFGRGGGGGDVIGTLGEMGGDGWETGGRVGGRTGGFGSGRTAGVTLIGSEGVIGAGGGATSGLDSCGSVTVAA